MKFNAIIVIYHRVLLAYIIMTQCSIFPNVCLPFSLYIFAKPYLEMCQSNINSNSPRWWTLMIYIVQVHSLSFIFVTKVYFYRKQYSNCSLQTGRKWPAGGRLLGWDLLLPIGLSGMGVIFGCWWNQHFQKSDGTGASLDRIRNEWRASLEGAPPKGS